MSAFWLRVAFYMTATGLLGLYGTAEDHDGDAEGHDEVEGIAKVCCFGEETYEGWADEETCVRRGGDGGEGRSCGHALGASRGAEGCGEDYGETGAGAGEAEERDKGLCYGQGDPESCGGEDSAGADEGGRAETFHEPVSKEASEGHGDGERRVARRREARARIEGVLQVDGAPVSHRPLPEENAERDDPEPQERPRRTGERGGLFLGGVGVRGQERLVGNGEGYRGQDGYSGEVGQGTDTAGRQETAKRGPGEASETPGRVEGGHDGTPVPSLDHDGLRVHRHIEPAVRRPEQHEGGNEEEQARRQRWRNEREDEQRRRRTNDAPAPQAGDQCPDQRHGGQGPDRGPEQGDAEQSLAKTETLLHGRYPHHPRPDHDPVGEKNPEHRETRQAQRRAVIRSRAAHARQNGSCNGGAYTNETRRGGSRVRAGLKPAPTAGLVPLQINVPADVAFDGAVVDDTGRGHVLEREA